MNIIIKPGFAEEANVGIAEIAVILNKLFKKYEQLGSLEEVATLSTGQVVMPILAFEPIPLYLKSNAIRNPHLHGRFAVYSKLPEDSKPCTRFILANRYKTQEAIIKELPVAIRDATFVKDGEEAIVDILLMLGAVKADKVSYFYSLTNCEGTNNHSFAVIHEYGKEGDPFCVATSYFSVEINK